MDHSLDGAREKLDRAREHMETLDAETTAFVNERPYRIVPKYYAKTLHATFRFAQDTSPPVLRWGVLVGDVIHEASSALDHIAWQFALKTRKRGRRPKRSTAWPVCLKEGDWDSKRTRQMLRHIGCDDRAFIKSRQPYPAPDGLDPRTHAFAMLRLLSGIDKHRVLNTAVLMPLDTDVELINIDALSDISAVRGIALCDEPAKQGAKFARVFLAEPCPDVDMNVKASLYIALFGREYGHMHRGHVFTILKAVTREVAKTVDEAELRL